MTIELGIEIGEDTSLKKGVFTEVNSSNDMSRLELEQNVRAFKKEL
jgi:hypothetical protein